MEYDSNKFAKSNDNAKLVEPSSAEIEIGDEVF